MFFKTSVLKVFKNFTVKHLCRSLFLISFIKNRVQDSFLLVKLAKFLWTPFHRTPSVAASVFCKDFVDRRILILILEDPMWLHLFYFLNKISFWFVKCLFSIDETLTLAYYFILLQNLLCFLCRFNQPLWKTPHRINVLHWRIKPNKNFLRNHAMPGLFYKNCSSGQVCIITVTNIIILELLPPWFVYSGTPQVTNLFFFHGS